MLDNGIVRVVIGERGQITSLDRLRVRAGGDRPRRGG